MKGDATSSRRFPGKQADSKKKGSVGVTVTVTACRKPSHSVRVLATTRLTRNTDTLSPDIFEGKIKAGLCVFLTLLGSPIYIRILWKEII